MRRPPKPKRAAAAATFLLSLSLLLLPLGFVATHRAFSGGVAAASTSTAKRVLLGDDAHANAGAAEHAAAVERHCAGTLHRDVCASTLATIPDLAQKPVRDVISAVVARAAAAVRASASNCSAYLRRPAGAGAGALRVRDRLALSDCVELLGHTLAQLGTAEEELSAGNRTVTDEESVAGVQTVLSAALTNQYTCLDGFTGPSASEDGRVRPYIQGRIYHVAHLVSNSLAMLRRLPQRRRRGREALELEGYGRVRRGFPSWVSAADRRRLQQQVVPDLVVAKDGSGNFTTVGEAVAAAPNNSETRFVIYIKAGGYFENVEVGSEKTNLMFVGDGMWRTVIKASRNVVDNSTTFRSATLANAGGCTAVAQDTRSPYSVAFGVMQHGNDLVRSQTPNPCINAAARVGLALSCRPLRKRRWKRMQVISFCDRSGLEVASSSSTTPLQAKGHAGSHNHQGTTPCMATGSERRDGGDFVVMMLVSTVYSVSSCGLPSSLSVFFFVGPSFLLSLVPCVGLE